MPPSSPQPLLPAYSAISPTSVSHFPGAPSDKFIKLRDDTVNGHMKIKKRKKKEDGVVGAGWEKPGASLDAARRVLHSQGHADGRGEAASFFTIT